MIQTALVIGAGSSMGIRGGPLWFLQLVSAPGRRIRPSRSWSVRSLTDRSALPNRLCRGVLRRLR